MVCDVWSIGVGAQSSSFASSAWNSSGLPLQGERPSLDLEPGTALCFAPVYNG
jgi:hypothetical protein